MKKPFACYLIEDDEDDQEIFTMCLSKINSDIPCKVFSEGQSAIKDLLENKNTPPEFIFLDVNMPKMSGLECLQELRSMPFLDATKILMYSTSSEESFVDRAFKLGANDFIVKPAKINDLKDKLIRVFELQPVMFGSV